MKRVIVLTFLLIFMSSAYASIKSPNGKIKMDWQNQKGELRAQIWFNNELILPNFTFGLTIDKEDWNRFSITDTKKSRHKSNWVPIVGKQKEIENNYRQVELSLETEQKRRLSIIIRAYDSGVAFRYVIPKFEAKEKIIFNNDLTTITISDEALLWAPNGERKNIGPISFAKLNPEKEIQTPLVVKESKSWFAIHEAAIYDHSFFRLKPEVGCLKCDIHQSELSLPAQTSWRTFMIGENEASLLESNLLYNLNPPCKIEDTSWIKPGITMWDWRANGAKVDGFTYGINEQSYRRFIDFAAQKGLEYILFDANWYSEKGPTFPRKDVDMPMLIRYAQEKGVNILLYIDRKRRGGNNDWNLEDVLKVWHQWGAKGIKYGFLGRECRSSRQLFVQKTREIVELCAKYQMLVDFHDGPVPPSGDLRTWPNLITKEYCHAQSDARRAFTPSTFVTSAMVNAIAGSIDMTNGYFGLNNLMERRAIGQPVPSTVVAEAARSLIVFSGLVCIPDHPDAYLAKEDLFDFVKNIEGTWDETCVVSAQMDEYIVTARRKNNRWLVGAANNETARKITISFDFLQKGKYKAICFSDGDKMGFKGDKEAYIKSEKIIKAGENHTFEMAPGGGHCILIQKI